MGRLSSTVGLVPWQTRQQRCDSCPERRSESGTGGDEVAEEEAPPPSALLETYPTGTWATTLGFLQQVLDTDRKQERSDAYLCLVTGSWSDVKESELL